MVIHRLNGTIDIEWQTASGQIVFLKTVIYRITVGKQELKIVFSRTGIPEAIQPDFDYKTIERPGTAEDEYEVVKSVYLKRSGIESRLIIADEPVDSAHPETARAMQNAVSKALAWNDALINGTVASMTELAEQENVVPQFIVRRIKFLNHP